MKLKFNRFFFEHLKEVEVFVTHISYQYVCDNAVHDHILHTSYHNDYII